MTMAAAALLGLGLANGATAEEDPPTGAYVGVSLGHGVFEYLEGRSDFCRESGLCYIDDRTLAYSVYGGYELSPRFAVEAGYNGHRKLGHVLFGEYLCPDGRSVTDLREGTSTYSIHGAAVGRLPLDAGRFTPFAKLGAYWWKAKTVYSCGGTANNDDVAPLVGMGVDIAVHGRWRLRGEWTWFTESDGDVHASFAGINYRF